MRPPQAQECAKHILCSWSENFKNQVRRGDRFAVFAGCGADEGCRYIYNRHDRDSVNGIDGRAAYAFVCTLKEKIKV